MKLTEAIRRQLVRLVLRDTNISATAGSVEDKRLRVLEQRGALECYDSHFGRNYYHVTEAGRSALSPPGDGIEGA